MRMAIRYLTTFTYDTAVSESQNALRARPVSDHRQQLREYYVSVDPTVRITSHLDYWGTQVDCFGVVGRHTRLTVVADSVVETLAVDPPVPDAMWPPAVSWDAPEAEFLAVSPHVEWNDDVASFGRDVAAGSTSTVDAARAVQKAVGELLRYEAGSTEIGVSVAQIFEQRAGVCQDYAHLALAVYRSLGVPARYVSGYLYASDASRGDRPDAEEVDVSTHAWVEVLIPGYGWWGLDPTNQLDIGEQHVKIGHGRDYEDVMPLRGVYHGEAESGGLSARVKMSRAELDPYAMQPRPEYVRRQEQQ